MNGVFQHHMVLLDHAKVNPREGLVWESSTGQSTNFIEIGGDCCRQRLTNSSSLSPVQIVWAGFVTGCIRLAFPCHSLWTTDQEPFQPYFSLLQNQFSLCLDVAKVVRVWAKEVPSVTARFCVTRSKGSPRCVPVAGRVWVCDGLLWLPFV